MSTRYAAPAVSLAAALALSFIPSARAALLYDNGTWFNVAPTNTPAVGTVPGVSYRSPAPATGGGGDFGWPAEWLPNAAFDSAADDFTIDPASLGGLPDFKLSRIRLFAYESGATNTNNTITGAYLRIWNTKPTGPRLGANDARIVAGSVSTAATPDDAVPVMTQVVGDPLNDGPGRSVWTGIYRRGNAADVTTSRPVIAVDFDLSANAAFPQLPAGTYWLEVALLGSTAGTQAWLSTETLKGERSVEITGGNYVDSAGAGVGIVDQFGRTNIRPSIDFAFELYGDPAAAVPEPASLGILATAGIALAARRRR